MHHSPTANTAMSEVPVSVGDVELGLAQQALASTSEGAYGGTSAGANAPAAPRVLRDGRVLDDSQLAVLERGDESFAVIGAPGSGKTTTLIELAAHAVRSGRVGPSRFLVLAPGRAQASMLRDRLALRLGLVTEGPLARTPASLAYGIVRSAAARDGVPAPVLMTGSDHDTLIAELLAGHAEGAGQAPLWPDYLTAEVRATRQFRDEIRELALRATELGVSPERLAALARRSGRPEWGAAAVFLRELHHVSATMGDRRLDSAALIASARYELARAGRCSYDLILADDLQEFDPGALLLLGTLARRGARVVAFGDPDLSTKSFRGARTDALGRLGAVLGPGVGSPSYLQSVYRHGAAIRGSVQRVTERIGAAAAGKQRASASAPSPFGPGPEPEIHLLRSPAEEGERLAQLIRERHLLAGIPYREIAVIVRSNALADGVRRALHRADIPTRDASRGVVIGQHRVARALLRLAAASLELVPVDTEFVTEVLSSPLGGVDPLALRRLRLALRLEELAGGGARTADELLVEAFQRGGRFATIDVSAARRAARLSRLLSTLRDEARSAANAEDLLWSAWSGAGIADSLYRQSTSSRSRSADQELDAVVALFDAAKRYVERNPGDPAYAFVSAALSADVASDSLSDAPSGDAVTISTPSAVVGREYDTVMISGLQEGVWPNLRLRGSMLSPHLLDADGEFGTDEPREARSQVLADELRMFALALSRARSMCILTAVSDENQRPSALLRIVGGPDDSQSAEQSAPERVAPALDLRALVATLRRNVVEAGSPHAAAALARLAAAGVSGADPSEWYGLAPATGPAVLVDLEAEDAVFPVSPSHLEKFERSPLAWFVDRVAGARPSTAMATGTLLHSIFERTAQEEVPGFERALLQLDERWPELRFDASWLAARERRRAERKLAGVVEYLREFHDSGRSLVGCEIPFEFVLDVASLRGTVDRLEKTEGGLVVIDLKTGSTLPSARAVAEHLQLGVYQLAVLSGALGGDARTQGAALLYVGTASSANAPDHRLLTQPRLDLESATALRQRIVDAAHGMASGKYPGALVHDNFNPLGAYEYRVQLIGSVCE